MLPEKTNQICYHMDGAKKPECPLFEAPRSGLDKWKLPGSSFSFPLSMNVVGGRDVKQTAGNLRLVSQDDITVSEELQRSFLTTPFPPQGSLLNSVRLYTLVAVYFFEWSINTVILSTRMQFFKGKNRALFICDCPTQGQCLAHGR